MLAAARFGASCRCELRAGPVWANSVPFGPAEAHCGQKTRVPGRRGPRRCCLGSPDPSGATGSQRGVSFLGAILVLVAGASLVAAWLLACCGLLARRAGSPHCPNDGITQQKYLIFQLGGPRHIPGPIPNLAQGPHPYPHPTISSMSGPFSSPCTSSGSLLCLHPLASCVSASSP